MAAEISSASANHLVAATEDPWLDGLYQIVLSCFTQSRTEMESVAKKTDESSNVPWTISSTVTILTSDADIQRKILVEYISTTNGIRPLLELMDDTAKYKVGEKTAKILRELVSQKSGKHRTAIIKQCLDVNYLAVTVSVLKQLVKGSSSPSPATTATTGGGSKVNTAPSPPTSVSLVGTGDDDESSSGIGGDLTATGCTTTSDGNPNTAPSSSSSSSGCYNDLGNGTATTVDFIWFLAGVVAKDSHFPDKVRQMLKVKFFHDMFKKLFYAKSNMHFPLLKIMRQLSKCRRVSEILGKDKVMSSAKKSAAVLNAQPNQKMLMLMEWLSFLTRDRKNSIRFLKAGLLVKVLNIFRHWSHWKGKGLLKLSKYVINIYSHLARTKSGKKSLAQTDAISVIRAFCEQCPPERSFDDVIMRASAMIHVCYGKEHLPLENLECPIKFEIPQPHTPDGSSDFPGFLLLGDSGSSSDEDDPEADDEEDKDEDSDSDSGSIDDDNDSDSDDDVVDDDDVKEGAEAQGPGRGQSSRKCSLNDKGTIYNQEESERMTLDRIAQFSYFFREFSSQYSQENDEMENVGVNLEKLEQSMGWFSVLEEEGDDSSQVTTKSEKARNDENFNTAPIPILQYPTSVHKYSWTSRHGAKLPRLESLRKLYFHMANRIKHISPFVKIAYPDICFGLSGKQVESLCANTDRTVLRKKVQAAIARAMSEHPGFRPRVVYSLDELISNTKSQSSKQVIGNNDENEIARFDHRLPLSFESRFECGNLRKAIQVGEYEYDLLLTSDINSSRHNQWFYFQVSNVSDDLPYTFNIINCIKTNSLFNYGMQPVTYSVMDAMRNHRPGWVRSGSSVVYCRNGYKCIGKRSVKTYHTLSFTIQFHNKGDIVYIAYYIPYTYTRLMVETHNLLATVKHSDKVHCRYDVLCKSLDGNDIPLITITGPMGGAGGAQKFSRINDREVVFLTSRVHPGETNASWVMMGILRKLLLGNHMEELLQRYVFKVVPMLNVEGVLNGCHRSGLTSQDLNRCWKAPHEMLHPSIYNTKMLVAYCCKVRGRPPTAFIDLHGHSRRKNAFFYGCSFARSWRQEDRITPENPQKLYALAESMSIHCPYFVMHFCHYDVRKSRETTARVAIWREYGVTCSFTLECSYCGCDRGPSKGITFGTGQLWEIGESLCEAISTMDCKLQMSQSKLNELEDETVAVIESFIE